MRIAMLFAYLISGTAIVSWAQETGPATIGGVTYDRIDPGEPFTQRDLPSQDWQAPEPRAPERAAGMMAYVTPDPGDCKPYRIPKPEERVSELSAFLTPGEHEPVCVALYALADIKSLSVRIDLADAPVTVNVRHAHFWPQRTGWRSRQWYITPELLLPCADGSKTVPLKRGVLQELPFDVPSGESALLWLTLSARADAAPGAYQASVRIGGADREPLILPLEIQILPFELIKPADRYWLMYCDAHRFRAMSDGQVKSELRDFARHGMTGLVSMPLGAADLSEIADGRVTFDAAPFEKLAKQCMESGLPGPHVCNFGGMPGRVKGALGLDVDMAEGEWPAALKAGVEAVAKAAVTATADTPVKWYFYGVDEPRGDNTYAIQEYQSWRRGGAETYATFYNLGFLNQAAEYLTAPCFGVGLVSRESTARAAREACEESGAEFWWYGTGSYVNPFPQEGYMFHNRYGAGFLFWKTGAKAQVSWTFCRPHEDVFNDFDGSRANSAEPKEQATAYPHLLKPDDWSTYQGAIPTIAWEALREGVDDYRYLHTLASTIARAKTHESRAVREAAADAKVTIDEVIQAMPWANAMGGVAFETERMQQVRSLAASLIVDLRAAMAGRQPAAARPREARFTLDIRVQAPTKGASPMPAIPVMPTDQPPSIDGELADPCWRDGAVAGEFRDTRTAAPSAATTRARIAYDDRALYVAFDCLEPAMDKIVAIRRGHDTQSVWADDGVEFFLAGSDRQRYAHIIVNTNGSVYDEVNQDPRWDPDVEVGVSKRPDGWSAEFSVPWSALAQAGISRSPVMALNFCRNRFADPQADTHSAWSPTYGGFHAPDRFGTALMQEPPLALADLRVPGLWGDQFLQTRLKNLSAEHLVATVQLRGARRLQVPLAAGAAADLRIPVSLRRPGERVLTLAWGIAGQERFETRLATTVPAPITLHGTYGLVSPGQLVHTAIEVSLPASAREGCRVRMMIDAPEGAQTVILPAHPGESRRVPIRASGPVRLRAELIDSAGRVVGQPATTTLVPLPD